MYTPCGSHRQRSSCMDVDGIEINLCSDCESVEATELCYCLPEGGFCLDCLLENHRHPEEDLI